MNYNFIFLVVVTLIVGADVYYFIANKEDNYSYIFHRVTLQLFNRSNEEIVRNISNTLELGDAVQVLSMRNVSKSAFYLIETSQSGLVNPRQMCAVESAAKVHPEADVYLLVVQSTPQPLDLDSNFALQLALRHYPNIKVLSLIMTNYFQGSILEDWYLSGKLNKSSFRLVHTSDVLRVFTVFKYGGIYMDLDFVTRKPLSQYKNFLCPQSEVSIASGGFGFELNHPVPAKFVEEFCNTFNGQLWSQNGPELITRVMVRHCNMSIQNITKNGCGGITVLPIHAFYPYEYSNSGVFFDEKNYAKTMETLNSTMAVHVWNKMSAKSVITLGSNQPYGLLAKEYCPRTYWSCDSTF